MGKIYDWLDRTLCVDDDVEPRPESTVEKRLSGDVAFLIAAPFQVFWHLGRSIVDPDYARFPSTTASEISDMNSAIDRGDNDWTSSGGLRP